MAQYPLPVAAPATAPAPAPAGRKPRYGVAAALGGALGVVLMLLLAGSLVVLGDNSYLADSPFGTFVGTAIMMLPIALAGLGLVLLAVPNRRDVALGALVASATAGVTFIALAFYVLLLVGRAIGGFQ